MIISLTFNMKGKPKVFLSRVASYQLPVFLFASVFKQLKIIFFLSGNKVEEREKLFLLQAVAAEIHLYFFSEATLCK